jgi:hypothetical protein
MLVSYRNTKLCHNPADLDLKQAARTFTFTLVYKLYRMVRQMIIKVQTYTGEVTQ